MEEKKTKNKKIIIWTIGIITIITLLGTIGKTNSPKNTNKTQINKTSQYTKTQSTVSQNKERQNINYCISKNFNNKRFR